MARLDSRGRSGFGDLGIPSGPRIDALLPTCYDRVPVPAGGGYGAEAY